MQFADFLRLVVKLAVDVFIFFLQLVELGPEVEVFIVGTFVVLLMVILVLFDHSDGVLESEVLGLKLVVLLFLLEEFFHVSAFDVFFVLQADRV